MGRLKERIGIMGAGVVGGTLAQVLRDEGYDPKIYDPFKPGLDNLSVMENLDIAFICVWTPMVDNSMDESTVFEAVDQLCSVPDLAPDLIAIRSTILPGTISILIDAYPEQEFAFVPEFLTEADPYGTMRHTDRIIIGTCCGSQPELEKVLSQVSPGSPIIRMKPEEAVMVKLSSNGLLAAKVAIAVELAEICEAYDVDWETVRGGIGLDRRINPDHLRVTEEKGYGGSCFPKDVQGLIGAALARGRQPMILKEIQVANSLRRDAARGET